MSVAIKTKLPRPLVIIAIAQIIAIMVLPPAVIASISPVILGVVVLIFALLGWSLLRRRAWARVASIFIQGLSIIVHLLVIVPNAKLGTSPDSPWNIILLVTTFISIALSALVLYYIDLPDIQVLMQ